MLHSAKDYAAFWGWNAKPALAMAAPASAPTLAQRTAVLAERNPEFKEALEALCAAYGNESNQPRVPSAEPTAPFSRWGGAHLAHRVKILEQDVERLFRLVSAPQPVYAAPRPEPMFGEQIWPPRDPNRPYLCAASTQAAGSFPETFANVAFGRDACTGGDTTMGTPTKPPF